MLLLACGGDFSSANGMFASPGYPIRNYPNFADCRYEIRVKDGRRIVVIFDDFQLEQGYDTLMMERVVPGSIVHRQALTGSGNVGKRFFSVVNVFKFEFRSDGSVTKRGFVARYHSIQSGNLSQFLYMTTRNREESIDRLFFVLHRQGGLENQPES